MMTRYLFLYVPCFLYFCIAIINMYASIFLNLEPLLLSSYHVMYMVFFAVKFWPLEFGPSLGQKLDPPLIVESECSIGPIILSRKKCWPSEGKKNKTREREERGEGRENALAKMFILFSAVWTVVET
ncbi:unnamed protein product [Urochloa humidicola]